jgi:hypothetical protein
MILNVERLKDFENCMLRIQECNKSFTIKRTTGQYLGKMSEQPELLIEQGKAKRSVLQQAELESLRVVTGLEGLNTVRDMRKAFIQAYTGTDSKYLNELEKFFLRKKISSTGNSVVDLWHEYFDSLSIAKGTFNDRLKAFYALGGFADGLATDQSNTTRNSNQPFNNNVANQAIAQGVTATNAYLNKFAFRRQATLGTSNVSVTVEIVQDNSGVPTGDVLFSKTYTNAEWEALSTTADTTIVCNVDLGGVGLFWIKFSASAQGDASNTKRVVTSIGNVYADGAIFRFNGTIWSENTGQDLSFVTSTIE